jgi:outer membrane protein assembly factor BamD
MPQCQSNPVNRSRLTGGLLPGITCPIPPYKHKSMTARHHFSRVPFLLFSVGLATAMLGPACGGKTGTGAVDYEVSAERNYDKGMKAMENGDWIAAKKYFDYIRSRAQYTKFAVLAELRRADAEFGEEEYLASADSYRVFAKFHPNHEMVVNGYTSYKIGECYAKQLQDDGWLFPPAHEKEQFAAEEAGVEMRTFLEKFPQSPYAPKAKKVITDVGRRLADHEWYVANYYWDRDKPMGTVLRLRHLLENFKGVGYDEESLWLLGQAYVKVEMSDRARSAWTQLVTSYPSHARAADAKAALASLPAAVNTPATTTTPAPKTVPLSPPNEPPASTPPSAQPPM